MRLGPVEIAARESSLISSLAFARHLHDVRRAAALDIGFVSVSESRLASLALSGPAGLLGVTAGSRLHVCRRDGAGDFRAESWSYRNQTQLVACEWFAADGAVVIIADVAGHLRVLDVATSSPVRDVVFGAGSGFVHMAKSPVDHTLFVACLDGVEGARLVDIRNGAHNQVLGVTGIVNDPARAATCAAWSMVDRHQCVVGRADQTITIFDTRRPKPLYEIPLVWSDRTRPITDLRFSPNGANLFASVSGCRLIGWRVDGDQGLYKPTRTHAFSLQTDSRPRRIQFAVSSDSVFFPEGATVNVFEQFAAPGARPKQVAVGLGHITAALWDECDQTLYTGDDNGVVAVLTSKFGKSDAHEHESIVDWESYSDDSDIEFPLTQNLS